MEWSKTLGKIKNATLATSLTLVFGVPVVFAGERVDSAVRPTQYGAACQPGQVIVTPPIQVMPGTATAPSASAPSQGTPSIRPVPSPSTPSTSGAAPSPSTSGAAPSSTPLSDAISSAPSTADSGSGLYSGMEGSGTGGNASAAPNMFGDQFGGNRAGISRLVLPGPLNGTGAINFANAVRDPALETATVDLSSATPNVTAGPGNVIIPVTVPPEFSTESIEQGGVTGPHVTFLANPDVVIAANMALAGPDAQHINQLALATAQSLDPTIAGGLTTVQMDGTGSYNETSYLAGTLSYGLEINNIIYRNVAVNVPNPAGGGVVGRTKLSEDNSPLPRDRFIFNYDYYNGVPLGASSGWDVHRFSPGFEKTFFDRRASFEFRMPFAATMDNNYTQGAEGTSAEFGNLAMNLKALLLPGEVVNVSAGVQFSLPTGPDTIVNVAGLSAPLVRINNEAILVSPYLAMLFTPNDKLFAQFWTGASFDTSSSAVSVNPVLLGLQGTDLVRQGRLNDQTFLHLDAQVGYWIMKSDCATVRGLAPFIELHYNTSVSDADTVTVGLPRQRFVIGDLNGSIDELNLTLGGVAQIGDNMNLACGLVTPLKGGTDNFFNYQIGVRANWFFGPTAAARTRGTYTSSF